MRKELVLMLAAIFVFQAITSRAANVTFVPQEIKLQIAPGKTGRTAIAVHGFSNTAYSLSFLVGSRLKNSNIPKGWLTAAYLWLDSQQEGPSTCTMDLVVSVPANTEPGTYSGQLIPDDMRSSEPINSQGVTLAIEVTDH